MKLVIVESPAKAKTIEKFLGRGHKVVATYGHFRDLPKSKLGVDVDDNFEPQYVIPADSRKQASKLKKEALAAETVFLATDLDREGEAISWHVEQLLTSDKKLNKAAKQEVMDRIKRIEFNEITKQAILNAVANPRPIDHGLVDAQQARRVLDRLVGYPLSNLINRKVRRGLSAGRVQSVALKLIVDREREITAFQPVEYWKLAAQLKTAAGDEFQAELAKVAGEKADLTNGPQIDEIVEDLKSAEYVVGAVRQKEVKRNPAPPFITSTLQQEASRKLGFSVKKTMMLAQRLYEGINIGPEGAVGLITYMRTDSTHLSQQALMESKEMIERKFGSRYALEKPRVFRKVKGAQEAHEAVRPTYVDKTPEDLKEYLEPDQLKLYSLIWKRMVASQMAPAVYDSTSVDIMAKKYLFRATGRVVKFDGFTKLYMEAQGEEGAAAKEEKMLPALAVDEKLGLVKLAPSQHFTEPPPRYSEASLVKALEEHGIGRPSTYAPTLSTIINRGYVELTEKRFHPMPIGVIVTDFLTEHFSDIVDLNFTAGMEDKLDQVARGELSWRSLVADFWGPFSDNLEVKDKEVEKVGLPVQTTDEICDLCGSEMIIKHGRYGEFLSCSKYPECKGARPIIKETNVVCPKCKEGKLRHKKTRKNRIFWGCGRYPECDFATWNEPLPDPCPNCGGLVVKKGKKSVCMNTECGWTSDSAASAASA